MRVFVLIPVFNRLAHTQKVVASLRAQTLADSITIVIINDGSTDGTAAWLADQSDLVVIEGDGNLWWGGAMEEALKRVLPQTGSDDYILFQNNDTWFAADYVAQLVAASRENGNAAVGSVIMEEGRDRPLVSIGPRVNIDHMAVWDLLSEVSEDERRAPKDVYPVDALSGRGTLYRAEWFKRYGRMRPGLLPHYMADYEVAMRFARAGVPLVVSGRAVVFSPPVYGTESKRTYWQDRFGRRSPNNVFQRICFYMLVGSPVQRITSLPRHVMFSAMRIAYALLAVLRTWKRRYFSRPVR